MVHVLHANAISCAVTSSESNHVMSIKEEGLIMLSFPIWEPVYCQGWGQAQIQVLYILDTDFARHSACSYLVCNGFLNPSNMLPGCQIMIYDFTKWNQQWILHNIKYFCKRAHLRSSPIHEWSDWQPAIPSISHYLLMPILGCGHMTGLSSLIPNLNFESWDR